MVRALPLHLEILPPPQRRLWDELGGTPQEFVLYGGTALALQLGHRVSVDFDFFGFAPFVPERLSASVPYLAGAEFSPFEKDTINAIVDRGGPVHVSFMGGQTLSPIRPTIYLPQPGIHVASILDIAATKVATIQARPAAKDYTDIHAIITQAGIDLPTMLSAAQRVQGPEFNAYGSVRALTYYGDGDLHTVPASVQFALVDAARTVDLDRLPILEHARRLDEPEVLL